MKLRILAILSALLMTVAGTALADVTNGVSHANGTDTGTITSVTYGEGGLESVTFTSDNGQEWTISDGEFPDITEFGSQLERAYESGDEVTLEVEFKNLKKVTRKKRP